MHSSKEALDRCQSTVSSSNMGAGLHFGAKHREDNERVDLASRYFDGVLELKHDLGHCKRSREAY